MKVEPIFSCPGYFAGEDGRIYSQRNFNRWHTTTDNMRLLALHSNGGRYYGVTVCINSVRRYRKVHRLVFEAFHGECEGKEIHHVDGDPTNNKPENLIALDSEAHKSKHTTPKAVANAIKLLKREGYTVIKG